QGRTEGESAVAPTGLPAGGKNRTFPFHFSRRTSKLILRAFVPASFFTLKPILSLRNSMPEIPSKPHRRRHRGGRGRNKKIAALTGAPEALSLPVEALAAPAAAPVAAPQTVPAPPFQAQAAAPTTQAR